MNDDSTTQLSRRDFLAVGAITIAGVGDGPQLSQIAVPTDLQETADSEGFVAAPHLLGALESRPEPGDEFLADSTGVYVYQTDGSGSGNGEKYWLAIESGEVISGWNEFPMPVPTTQVDEVRTEEFTSFLDHTFARPNAPDTKNWNFTEADITKVDSEIRLDATTTLETTQRGNYAPGSEAVAGVALRLDGTPTAGRGEAGYFDGTEGFGVGEDTTDSYAFVLKDGTYHRVYRDDWNGHVPAKRVWVNDSPVITRFPHLFYGGGAIHIRALLHGGEDATLRTLHTFTPDNLPSSWPDGPPFDQPNLPLRFERDSLTGANVLANAAHYEIGETNAETRVNGEHFTAVTVPTDDWVPLLAWQKRNGWDMVNVKPLAVTAAVSTNNIKVELQLDPTLSASSFALPTHTSPEETAVEVSLPGNTTIGTDGERRWLGSIASGQGNRVGALSRGDLTVLGIWAEFRNFFSCNQPQGFRPISRAASRT